ncbi:DUF885 domain-containing protein [Actinosynnema pretiosum]|nr:DUF885 domain-containing protein [Actinosynnema pretiosum]
MTTARELADDLFTLVLTSDPLMATLIGVPGWDDRLPDPSAEAEAGAARRAAELATRAAEGDDDPITRAVVAQQAAGTVAKLGARLVEHTHAEGFNAPVPLLLTSLSMVRPASGQGELDYLARLRAVPGYLEALATRQLDSDRRPLAHLVDAAVTRLDRHLADPSGPLRVPPLSAGPAAERERLITELVDPALARYRDVLRERVAPRGRSADEPGLCWLADGERHYAGLVAAYTTTERTARELHEVGLGLVAELDREYEEIGARVFGPLPGADARERAAGVRARLLADPELRWTDGAQMVELARRVLARAELAAGDWFGSVPAKRCAVATVPDDEAPNAPLAYYVDPAVDGSRPGTYFVNTHRAAERNRVSAEAVAFHEGVPGHHFQISLAQELTDLPPLRRFAAFEAYLEGWGLYAERLADEMGLYSGDLARLGMLSADSLRAARLVVDTGMHALGWTRERAVEYLRASTAAPEADVQAEVDRYIEAPAQALSYMVGRLEIQRLRGVASDRLGAAFDIRAFHDLVLRGGPLPLGVLADVVDRWCGSA